MLCVYNRCYNSIRLLNGIINWNYFVSSSSPPLCCVWCGGDKILLLYSLIINNNNNFYYYYYYCYFIVLKNNTKSIFSTNSINYEDCTFKRNKQQY